MGWPKDPGGDGAKLLQELNGLAGRSKPRRLRMRWSGRECSTKLQAQREQSQGVLVRLLFFD